MKALVSTLQQVASTVAAPSAALKWVQSYKLPFSENDDGLLAPNGIQEHAGLGARMKQQFPFITKSAYSPNIVAMRHTDISRTGMSASS